MGSEVSDISVIFLEMLKVSFSWTIVFDSKPREGSISNSIPLSILAKKLSVLSLYEAPPSIFR